MKKLPLLVLAIGLVIAPSALAAKTHTKNLFYRVTRAQGTETATFQGNAPACTTSNLCGDSGTVSYTFTHRANGFSIGLLTLVTRKGHRPDGIGDFEFDTLGKTTSNVAQAGAPPCVDTVNRATDGLQMLVSSRGVRFEFHTGTAVFNSDFLGTHCAGPTETDMDTVRAFPSVTLPFGAFKRKRVSFEMHSNEPFRIGPFAGTLKVDAAYTMVRLHSR